MASIKISELRPVGSELFQDSESFLNELNAQDMEGVMGASVAVATALTQSVGSVATVASASGGQISQSVGFTAVATLSIAG
ncbi:MAG: hypothetical protein V7L29_32310 [Nostoc sp.]|uniref:hypothetical protein n=1 Tax=Nostoc sp. TaxID=1180 RepID=UPI002FEF34B2